MRRLILILASILVCWSAIAQKPTKEERKALQAERKAMRIEHRAERAEYYRIKDSLLWAEINRADSIRNVERKKEGTTDIIATTSLSVTKAIDHVARSLIAADYVIAVDKEYGTIKTEQVSAEGINYSLYFRFVHHDNGTEVKACAFAHRNAGIAMYGIVSTNSYTVKVTNGHHQSVSHTAFSAYEKVLITLPDVQLQYIKEDK